MNTFSVGSFQLKESQKWVPAGTLFSVDQDRMNIQEIEFSPEHGFDTKEEADNFFRSRYIAQGYTEKT